MCLRSPFGLVVRFVYSLYAFGLVFGGYDMYRSRCVAMICVLCSACRMAC